MAPWFDDRSGLCCGPIVSGLEKHMRRISTLALVVSLIAATKSEASLIWTWSFAGETGEFITDGVTPSPGIYTLEDFIVRSDSFGEGGSIGFGDYSASGFSTMPPYRMTWNGREVTFWDSAGTNHADWWPFTNVRTQTTFYLFGFDVPNVNDPKSAALWDLTTREALAVGQVTVAPVPEPATWLLLSSGLLSAGARWRAKAQRGGSRKKRL